MKCDGDPALKSVQEEVKRRRTESTVLENSPVGDSRANGSAERAVQAIGEQVRVLRRGLERRLGLKVSGKHPVMAWLVEHAADVLSKNQVGGDGRTAYELLKGKKSQQETVEFGEKVHYRYNLKARSKDEKLEVKWGEGFFLGKWWRSGEAVIGTKDGILRAGTNRRVGGHRRWDREGLEQVRGVPWQWDPEQGEVHADLKVRWLTEEEWDRGGAVYGDEGKKVYRLRLRKVDFLNHGFTEGCVGCQALISGAEARGHSESCRERMNKALENTDEGRLRRERQHKRENEALAKHLEKEFGGNDEERSRKVARQVEQATGSERRKRKFEDDVQDGSASSSWENVSTKSQRGLTLQRGQKRSAEDEEKDMELSIMERTRQEDMRWDLMEVCDMCVPDNEDLHRSKYFDENTCEELDPERVAEGERAELERFKKRWACTTLRRVQLR